MGRGNYYPLGELTDQWYIDFENYYVKGDDEISEADWFDEDLLDEDIYNIMTAIEKKYKSFCHVNKRGYGLHGSYWCEQVMLENQFFEIGTADNTWSAAIYIREKDSVWPEHMNLAKKHFKEYQTGIKNILLDYFGSISIRNGAWMSGTLTKETANA